MIYLGYACIFAYLAALIVCSEKLLPKIWKREYCRKVLHIGTFAALPIANAFWGRGSVHFAVTCAVFTVLTAVMYFSGKFEHLDDRKEKYPGIFYYALSLFVCALFCFFFNEWSGCFAIAFIGLAFGDGFATLIGTSVKSPKIYKNKTLAGFLSCFLVTFLSILIYDAVTEKAFSAPQVAVLALFAAIVELVDLGLDNLAIPLGLFFASYAMTAVEGVAPAMIVFECVFAVAFFSKFITYYGSLLAAAIGFLFFFFMGYPGFAFVIGCYAVLLAISLVRKKLKNDISDVVKKTKGKDFFEVLVNGAWAICSLVLFAVTKNEIFTVCALLSVSEGFVDSIASDVGTLSKKKPYDVFRGKQVEKGVSGGVTLLGSTASLIGACGFSAAIVWITGSSWIRLPIYTAMLYFGSAMDSLLGSTLQVKYRCAVCGKITEREEHCGLPTEQVCGHRFFNNDTVNMLSGLSVFLVSLLLLFV